MENPALIERFLRHYNYLIILNGTIRKVYLVDIRIFTPSGEITTVNKLIESEIEKISPDLELIINKNNSEFFAVVNKKNILPEDIAFLENVSASIFERIEKNEDEKLGNLLGYACPMVGPDTPLRMNISFTARSNIGTITLFNFVCVLTQQNFQRSNALLADVKNALLSTGVIVKMTIQGPNRTIDSSMLNASKLPDEQTSIRYHTMILPAKHLIKKSRYDSHYDSGDSGDNDNNVSLSDIKIQVLDGKGIRKKTNKRSRKDKRRNKRSRKDKRRK